MVEMSESILPLQPTRPNLWCTFDGQLLDRLGN